MTSKLTIRQSTYHTFFPPNLRLTLTLALAFTLAGFSGETEALKENGCPLDTECVHGYCPAESVSCVCEHGWAGFHCEQKCPDDCLEDGACQTNPEGLPYCFCGNQTLQYVVGMGCKPNDGTDWSNITVASINNTTVITNTVPSTTMTAGEGNNVSLTAPNKTGSPGSVESTTLRPMPSRTCVPGFMCIHGRCATEEIACICDKGWIGFFCHERCDKNCSEYGKCHLLNNGDQVCSCDSTHTGEFCERDITPPSKPTSVTELTLSTKTTIQTLSCLQGLDCLHGNCTETPENGTAQCVCDPGWEGQRCHEKKTVCNMDCGLHGDCIFLDGRGEGSGEDQGLRNDSGGVVGDGGVGGDDDGVGGVAMGCMCADGHIDTRCDDKSRGFETWKAEGLRPISERQCVPGFVCKYGRCSTTTPNNQVKCDCDPGYVGVFCHQPCSLTCVHGKCHVFPNQTAVCDCQHGYTGDDCSELFEFPDLTPGDNTIHWYIVGACAALLLILLVLLVALPYWMWKRGHIFVMKIVYRLKAFEDDDQKQYDAFISYSSMDEQFVVHELFPRLSAMRFSVCVHSKDFIAGETIANNIIEAIDNSRRTILVLTPHFIHSQFCRFEYQQAQYQMIQNKHRIVPIMLHDVSQEKKNMDATMKSLLNTITYLSWPHDDDPKQVDKFWKRLELSMPKRKAKQESPIHRHISIYSKKDSSSSGYSTSSSANGYKTTSVSGPSSSSASVQSKSSNHTRGANNIKKSRSISGQSTSSRDSRPRKHRRNRPKASESSSRSRSNSRGARSDSVVLEMEQPRRTASIPRQGFSNPVYAMP